LQSARALRKRDGYAGKYKYGASETYDPMRDSWRGREVDPAHGRSTDEYTETDATDGNARSGLTR
jgi:hypothetical protein